MLDCVRSQATVDLARAVVTTGGDIAIVGLAGGALPVGFGPIAMETRVSVPFWGTRAELAELRQAFRALEARLAERDGR